MSKLQELIKELCPDGVEFRKLGEVCEFINGFAFKSSLFKDEGLPIIRITNINGVSIDLSDVKFFDLRDYKSNLQSFSVSFGDILIAMSGATTGKIGYYDNEDIAYLNQRVGKFVPNVNKLNNRYLFHFLHSKTAELYIMAGGGAQPNLSSNKLMNELYIPLPPLEVQNEIVRILDTFTSHAAELQAELQARKEQYEYYRNKLLSFDENDEGVKWMRMEEVGTFIRGKRFVRTDIVEKGISCIHYGDMYTYYGLSANKTKGMLRSDLASKMRYAQKNDVVIVAAGENKDDIGVGLAWLGDEPAAVHDACFIFQSDMYSLFVSHYLRTDIYHKQIRKYVSEAKICSISAKGLGNAVIPVPSFERQQSIASLLDKFESLVNDLTTGLPAEIAAVQEQYEYYRNKLLTFERKS